MTIRLLIVDDHSTVREALKYVFEADGDVELQMASTAQEAAQLARGDVDVVLLDIALPDGDGFEVLRDIQTIVPPLPVVFHSLRDDRHTLSRSYLRGASGYVVKGSDTNRLLHVVRTAATGKSVWDAKQLADIQRTGALTAKIEPLEQR